MLYVPSINTVHQCRSRVTAENLQPLSNPTRSQLEEWRKKAERHEQVAVGEQVQRPSKNELKKQLKREEKRIEGKRS